MGAKRSGSWRRAFGALAIVAGAGGATGCDVPATSSASVTTSTLYPCWLDAVVLDPDRDIATVEPGCTINFELEASGPGGNFDLVMQDSAGGYTESPVYDPYPLSGTERFEVRMPAASSASTFAWCFSGSESPGYAPARRRLGTTQ